MGEALELFTATWQRTHRPQAQAAHDQLSRWTAELRRQVNQQELTSSGWSPHDAKATAPAMLAFARRAEEWRDPVTELPPGWHALSSGELRALGIDPSSLHKSGGTGMDATVFTDGHHYVVSYAGSAGSMVSSEDWYDDYASALDPLHVSRQTEQAADLAASLTARVGTDNVILTGHSLGGRDAAVASVASGAAAVTFNASGVTDTDLMYARSLAGETPSPWPGGSGDDVTNYVVADDPVTLLQGFGSALGVPTALGHDNVVAPDLFDLGHPHGLDNFEGEV
jgi:hypothetical protein